MPELQINVHNGLRVQCYLGLTPDTQGTSKQRRLGYTSLGAG